MFIVYFFEGLIIGSLLGLLLRHPLDYYVAWRRAKAFEESDAKSIHVDLARPPGFDAASRITNGNGAGVKHRDATSH